MQALLSHYPETRAHLALSRSTGPCGCGPTGQVLRTSGNEAAQTYYSKLSALLKEGGSGPPGKGAQTLLQIPLVNATVTDANYADRDCQGARCTLLEDQGDVGQVASVVGDLAFTQVPQPRASEKSLLSAPSAPDIRRKLEDFASQKPTK